MNGEIEKHSSFLNTRWSQMTGEIRRDVVKLWYLLGNFFKKLDEIFRLFRGDLTYKLWFFCLVFTDSCGRILAEGLTTLLQDLVQGESVLKIILSSLL